MDEQQIERKFQRNGTTYAMNTANSAAHTRGDGVKKITIVMFCSKVHPTGAGMDRTCWQR